MKQLLMRLALVMASICAFATIKAERTAPTFPTPAAPESGKTYYLYNVGTGTFFADEAKSSSDYAYLGTYGRPMLLTQVESGSWLIQPADTEEYVYASGSSTIYLDGSSISNSSYWSFAETTGGYTWQKATENSSYYDALQFVGYSSTATNNQATADQTADNIVWQFLSAEETERWTAEQKLYVALQSADGYGYVLDEYETLYTDRASHTPEELTAAATRLTAGLEASTTLTAPDWSDYPVFLFTDANVWSVYSNSIQHNFIQGETASLYATVKTDEDATLVFQPSCSYNYGANTTIEVEIYLDGELVRTINRYMMGGHINDCYFEPLTAGKHNIEWRFKQCGSVGSYYGLTYVGIENTPLISVNLLEPGSLGTEVLYNVDHVKDVRRLKVTGPMNNDDWTRIGMMTNLFELDLSEAEITAIPENQFKNSSESDGNSFFHKITLPEGLESIGDHAFQDSYVDHVNLPNTLKSVGVNAFYGSYIQEALIGDSISSVLDAAFRDCYQLYRATWPKSISTIPTHCFCNSHALSDLSLPEGVKTIDTRAFYNCFSLDLSLPSTIKSIGYEAIYHTSTDSLILSEGVSIDSRAFSENYKLRYAQFPTSFATINNSYILNKCTNLRTLVLQSPTMVNGSSKDDFLLGIPEDSVTIRVPSFAVNAYKLDEYWYNYKIEGFSTADIKNWTINQALVLNARDRFEGSPNIRINGGGSLKINGEKAQVIDTLNTFINGNKATSSGQFLANCDSVSVAGQNIVRFYTTANQWYFVSLPFNIAVADITNDASAQWAIRRYDGAERAANGMGASWKNFTATDTITAGTGFILQSSKDATYYFTALNDSAKQYTVNNQEFAKHLEANVCETLANKGWNLVGNPYLSYYNIHKLNFTAPITTWSVNNRTYTAYSVIDDDLALVPGQAFFVQCPDEVESISFPLEGRQLTSEILDQNATHAHKDKVSTRQLIDLCVTQGELTDRTRIVLNEEATLGYEYACDASKFMSEDAAVPQLYSIDAAGTRYAINERPETDGTVRLGFHTAQGGVFTLGLARCNAQEVFLTDHLTGTITDLKASDYHFTAEAGTDNSRFTLSVEAKQPTGIDAAQTDSNVSITESGLVLNQAAEIYAADGRLVAKTSAAGETVTLPAGTYLVKVGGKVQKVSVIR